MLRNGCGLCRPFLPAAITAMIVLLVSAPSGRLRTLSFSTRRTFVVPSMLWRPHVIASQRLHQGPSRSDVDAAIRTVNNAQGTLKAREGQAKVRAGPTPEQIQDAEANLASAQASLARAPDPSA